MLFEFPGFYDFVGIQLSIIMNTPLVSICIPTFNGEKFLSNALLSASAQVGDDIEIIISDDCSSDRSLEIALKHAEKDPRVRVLHAKYNRGLVGNFNYCIAEARGEWIKFLLQDDVLSSSYMARVSPYLGGICPFIVTRRSFIIEPGTPDSIASLYKKLPSLSDVVLAERVLTAEDFAWILVNFINVNFIGEPSNTIFRRSAIQDIGFFSIDMKQIVDLELWARLGCRYGVVSIPEVLSAFRVHPSSASSKNFLTSYFKSTAIDVLILLHDYCFSKDYRTLRNVAQRSNISLPRLLDSYLLVIDKEISKLEAAGIGTSAVESEIFRPLGECCLNRPVLWRLLRGRLPVRAAIISGLFSELVNK